MTGYQVQVERLNNVAIINLRCALDVAANISNQTGITLPQTAFLSEQASNCQSVRLSPDQWWIRTRSENEQAIYTALKDATHDTFAAVTIISDHFQGFDIKGPDTQAIMSQATSVDTATLNSGVVTRGKFLRSGGTFYIVDAATHTQVFVESSYADYIEAYLASLCESRK